MARLPDTSRRGQSRDDAARPDVLWTRDEGTALVDRLGAAVENHGCRLRLIGSVATRGWSHKDLDIELHVDGEDRTIERVLGAIDAVRFTRHRLVSHWDNQVMLLDACFRPVELWLDAPRVFWRDVRTFTERMLRRIREDKVKLVTSLARARKHGRPDGFDHVPVELLERERETLAAFLSNRERPLAEGSEVSRTPQRPCFPRQPDDTICRRAYF